MRSTMLRAGFAALLSLALLSPAAHANYVGSQAGGGDNITIGAFAPTINGVVTQLTKSVPVDPVSGNAIFTATLPGYVTLSGTPTVNLGTIGGAATATAQATGNTSLAAIAAANGNPTDTAWDGSASSAAQVGILKSIWGKLSGLLTVDTVVRSTSVNRGGTLTTASTAVTLVPADASRRGLVVQNRNAPGASYTAATSVFMNCLATATADFNSLEIPAGALYATDPHHSGTGPCSFISPTANTPVYIRTF